MSDAFTAGFVSRHAAEPARLRAALAPAPGFAPAASPVRPVHFSPQEARSGPKHFSPADRSVNPTEGWDPLDPSVPGTGDVAAESAEAHAQAFEEGFAAGRALAAEEQARDRAFLADLTRALGGAGRIDREAVAERLRGTVLLLLSRLVGEVGVSAELLAARVSAATGLLADANESALLRVHPDDVPLLEGRLPDSVFAAGDASVARGSFVLESASTVVEDGPDLWLGQLAAAIDRVPVPPQC